MVFYLGWASLHNEVPETGISVTSGSRLGIRRLFVYVISYRERSKKVPTLSQPDDLQKTVTIQSERYSSQDLSDHREMLWQKE